MSCPDLHRRPARDGRRAERVAAALPRDALVAQDLLGRDDEERLEAVEARRARDGPALVAERRLREDLEDVVARTGVTTAVKTRAVNVMKSQRR